MFVELPHLHAYLGHLMLFFFFEFLICSLDTVTNSTCLEIPF